MRSIVAEQVFEARQQRRPEAVTLEVSLN